MFRAISGLLRRAFGGDTAEQRGHRVVILGAGASRAQWLWEREAGERPLAAAPPPLNVDFFTIAGELQVELAEEVLEQVRLLLGLDASAPDPTLEEAFDAVFSRSTHDPSDTNARLLLIAFMVLLATVIGRTTNDLCVNASGPIDEMVFYSLRAPHVGHLTIINFNYDLLVEKSLVAHVLGEGGRTAKGAWYGMAVTDARGRQVQLPYTLLKPHGSLNWLTHSGFAGEPARVHGLGFPEIRVPDELEVPLDADGVYDTMYHADIARGRFFMPYVIPPVATKSKVGTVRLELQERMMVDAITTADEVVVFGYSFPETDDTAHAMLSALESAGRRPRIAVVSPSDRVLTLLRSRLGSDAPIVHDETVHDLVWSGHLSPFSQ